MFESSWRLWEISVFPLTKLIMDVPISPVGVCTPCAKNRKLDEAGFNTNMVVDGGPHLIDMAAEAQIFNF